MSLLFRKRAAQALKPALQRELLAGPAVVIALLCALVLVTLVSRERIHVAARATEAGWGRLVSTQDARRQMSQIADDYTTFFATGDERFAQSARARIAEFRALLGKLREEADGEESRRLHGRAVERAEAWIGEFVEPNFALRGRITEGKSNEALLQQTIRFDDSSAWQRDVSAMLDLIEDLERKKLALLRVEQKRVDERLVQLLCGGAALAVVLGVLVAVHFSRSIGLRIERLRDSAARIGRGDFSQRLSVDSGDAIGDLTAALNQMTDGLVSALHEQQQAQSALLASEEHRVRSDHLAAIGTLAAGMAHEINNPLTYVIANLGQIASELPALSMQATGEQRAEIEVMVAEALHGAERVKCIVRDLKIFSRVEPDRRVPVDVCAVLKSSINMASNEIKHRARLVTDFASCTQVLANEAQLGQVFLNLLVNAAQAIPEGNAAAQEIRVTTRDRSGGQVVIEVSDTGTGISEETRSQIFDPFFTTKPVGEGTGLGLSICRGLINGFGGKIEVQSRVGSGTTFTISLPGLSEQTNRNGGRKPRNEPTLQGRAIRDNKEPRVS